MMKNILILIIELLLTSCSEIANKSYKSRISSSCAKTSNGGYMIYDYCHLYFKKDSVKIHFYQKTTEDRVSIRESKWEKHLYKFQRDTIIIKGSRYGKLFYKKDTLLYFYKLGNGNIENLKFIKQ